MWQEDPVDSRRFAVIERLGHLFTRSSRMRSWRALRPPRKLMTAFLIQRAASSIHTTSAQLSRCDVLRIGKLEEIRKQLCEQLPSLGAVLSWAHHMISRSWLKVLRTSSCKLKLKALESMTLGKCLQGCRLHLNPK